jgi:WD40 repeat protein
MFRIAALSLLLVVTGLRADEPLKLNGHEQELLALAFSPKGDRLASASNDRTIRIWTLADGKSVTIKTGFASRTVAFSLDGKHVAGRFENKASIWDAADGTKVAALAGSPDKDGTVTRVAFSPDGKTLAVGHQKGLVRLWDSATFKPIADLAREGNVGELQDSINGLAFSPNGKSLAVAGERGLVVWDLTSQVIEKTVDDKTKTFTVEFTPDGKRLLVNDENRVGHFRIWEVESWKNLHTSNVDKLNSEQHLKAVAVIDDSTALGVNYEDQFEMFDLKKLERQKNGFATPYRYAPGSFAVAPDHKSVAHYFGGNKYTIYVQSLPTTK